MSVYALKSMVCINRISELAKQINEDYLILLDMGLSYLGRDLLKNALRTLVFIDVFFLLSKKNIYQESDCRKCIYEQTKNRTPKGAMEV